jgi:hypothetical protein
LDWWVAARVVTYKRVDWAIDSFAPYKSLGMDGLILALLQEGQRIVVPYLVRIFRACLAAGYVPAIWRQVKVVFIPKPGRNSYSGPTDFRPISITLSLFKTMERLVDRLLRDKILDSVPLHPNQHSYPAGKFMDMALHQLMVQVQKVLGQQETALGVFLDIEGEFNNTSYDLMCADLFKHGVDYTIIQWITVTLDGRLAAAALGRLSKRVVVSRGCPQVGVLSPFLWCLLDDLIARLNGGGIYTQGYADDICLLVVGKFLNTILGLIQWTLRTVDTWCDKVRCSVNPDKTGRIVFTRRGKFPGFFEPHFFGVTLHRSTLVKYVVVSKIFWTDAVKIIKLTIRPIGCHHPQSSSLPHVDTGPVSSIFGMLPASPFLSEC